MTARRARRGLRVPLAVLRLAVRQLGRRCLAPALPWPAQRTRLDQPTRISLRPRGTMVAEQAIAGVRAEVVSSSRAPGSQGPAGPQRTVIHFHGGGYCMGSAVTARSWAAHLSARTGCRVVLPEYRLAPEDPYPAALEDARAVLKALSGEVGGSRPGSVVVSGDSAGGGVAVARSRPRPPGRPRPGEPGRPAQPGLDRRLRPRVRRPVHLGRPPGLPVVRCALWATAAADPGRHRRTAGPRRRVASRQRFGRRGERDLHQVAAHVAQLRAPARSARRCRQRAGASILVRHPGDGRFVTLAAGTRGG